MASTPGDGEPPLIFVSYRRADTKPAVRALVRDLALAFGTDSVFVDTDGIRGGSRWKVEIEDALRRCTVLVVAIGNGWLGAADEFHRRRIDDADDWVRTEIVYALEHGRHVLPVRFDGAPDLPPESLPDVLRPLADIQSVELRTSDWQEDVEALLRRLREIGFDPPSPAVRYPTPVIVEPVASDAEIGEFLRRHPEWQIRYRKHPTDPGAQRRGIGTTFTFRSFPDAMHFMTTASWGIEERCHHPEWENVWRTVTVWITQFDIGGDITARNLELAEYLVGVYQPYRAALERS